MFQFIAFLGAFLAASRSFANPACTVCTVAIGASLSIARSFGVDDCVVGIWSGAFLALLGYWTIRFFDKRGWIFWGRDPLLIALNVALVGFMYLGELSYNPTIIGFLYIDSFLFSNIVGAFVLIFANHFYVWLKAKNGGHAHFPFEKVFIPVALVFATSVLFHFFPVCDCHGGF